VTEAQKNHCHETDLYALAKKRLNLVVEKKGRQKIPETGANENFLDKASIIIVGKRKFQGRVEAKIWTCHDSDLLPVALAKIPAFSPGIPPISHLSLNSALSAKPVHLFPPFTMQPTLH
jgi:hypothetical protein